MRRNNIFTFCLLAPLLLCLSHTVSAQADSLTLLDAMEEGMAENLGLEVMQFDLESAGFRNAPGAAGMRPTVELQGNAEASFSRADQLFVGEQDAVQAEGASLNFGAELLMNWTIFDGMGMFVRKDILEQEEEQSRLNLKKAAFDLSAEISGLYQDLVLRQSLLQIYAEQIIYLEDLRDATVAKLEIGTSTRMDLLQIETDLKAMENQRELLRFEYADRRADINRLLNRNPLDEYAVEAHFVNTQKRTYGDWAEIALAVNYDLQVADYNTLLAEKEKELAASQKWPQLDLNAGATYGWLRSSTGFLIRNQSYGPYIGLTGRYTIYDGKRIARENALADIGYEQSLLRRKDEESKLEADLYKQYRSYQYYDLQMENEEEILALVEENFALAKEVYKSGRMTQFELRQVYLQLLEVRERVLRAKHQRARAYINLMQLSGEGQR